MRTASLCALASLAAACRQAPPADTITPAVLVSGDSSIPYPPDLYAQRVEGAVMLYVVVDSSGAVVRDSTRVTRSSGHAAFDAAALQAAPRLRFTPAFRGTVPVAAPIKVPIRFTLPDSLRRSSGTH
ncbi:MAG TPA: TonB family protein [Gemmatimonadales bacterium]